MLVSGHLPGRAMVPVLASPAPHARVGTTATTVRACPGYPPRMDVRGLGEAMESRRAAFVEALGDLVSIDSGTYTPAGVNLVADALEARFRASGWAIERRPHTPANDQPPLGDAGQRAVRGGRGAERRARLLHRG